MEKKIVLADRERIIAVVPETCSGPGWSNRLVWVHIINWGTAQMRTEAIQETEFNAELHALFNAGEAMSQALQQALRDYTQDKLEQSL